MLYSNPSLSLTVASSVPSIPSDALVYYRESKRASTVSSASRQDFFPSTRKFLRSCQIPRTSRQVVIRARFWESTTGFCFINSSVDLLWSRVVYWVIRNSSVQLESSTHVIASYGVRARAESFVSPTSNGTWLSENSLL